MEHIDEQFEQYIRKELDKVQATPDEDLWSGIAAQQQKINSRWRYRYLLQTALPIAAVFLGGLLIWKQTNTQPTPLTPQHNTEVAASPAAETATHPTSAIPPSTPPALSTNTHINTLPSWYRQNQAPIDRIRFIAETGIEYQNPISGNKVSIPANALVYADGTPVSGEVDLFFREYRDIPDFLASDLPMHYSDNRGQFFFNSGGMFDVRVSQQGAELFMAPGRTYDMQFSATNQLSDASLYYFDETNNQWAFLSTKPFQKNESAGAQARLVYNQLNPGATGQPVILDETLVARENTAQRTPKPCIPQMLVIPPGADPVDWVKQSVELGYDLAFKKRSLPAWFKKYPTGSDAYFASALEQSDVRIVRSEDTETRFFPEDQNGHFTELNAFKGCYFVRTGDTLSNLRPDASLNTIDALFKRIISWRSVSIVQVDGAECIVELADGKDGIRLHARLYPSGMSHSAKDFNPNALFEEYHRLKDIRQEGLRQQLKALRIFMAISPMFQESNEWCMSGKQWLTYFDAELTRMRARYQQLVQQGMTTDDIYIAQKLEAWRKSIRDMNLDWIENPKSNNTSGQNLAVVLNLSGFGTYNCDQIYSLSRNPYKLAAHFKTDAGQVVNMRSVRLIDRQTRLFISLSALDQIIVFPGRPMDMIVNDIHGRIYHLPYQEYVKLEIKDRSTFTFTIKDITDTVKSPRDWAQLLEI